MDHPGGPVQDQGPAATEGHPGAGLGLAADPVGGQGLGASPDPEAGAGPSLVHEARKGVEAEVVAAVKVRENHPKAEAAVKALTETEEVLPHL